MTRRPIIVVCAQTGRADVRTYADEVNGSYYWSPTPFERWQCYLATTERGTYLFNTKEEALAALETATPAPADAVWGPGTEVQDEPKPTTPSAYSYGYRAGITQSGAIIDSLRARVRELEAKENVNG